MRIQNLAIMFIILILPISLVLSSYTQNRIETLRLQSQYDSRLINSTYDALKAYQLNNLNSTVGEYTNTKLEDIEASVNTFFTSLSNSFTDVGYTKNTIQNYVPALVYTMYDGYYIYSPFTNKLDQTTNDSLEKSDSNQYYDGDKLYGLKPYVYYSCRYKSGSFDVVITYALDNYITIQGLVDGDYINCSGYLLDTVQSNISKNKTTNDDYRKGLVSFRGAQIKNETYEENVYIEGEGLKTYPTIKIKGTKYYCNETTNEVFSVLNGKKQPQSQITADEVLNNTSAKRYYTESYYLKEFIQSSSLKDLNTSHIVDEKGNPYNDSNNPYQKIDKIFNFYYGTTNTIRIESETSDFNEHRRDVIKHSIEKNLSVAISNFNNYSGLTNNFQMPKLKETDWDKLLDNISIISFLQGMNIGGKVYNGYSIVTNTKNQDVVMEDSIYLKEGSNIYRITEDRTFSEGVVGIYNINLERRTTQDLNGNPIYYFPIEGVLSYDSIVTQNNINKYAYQKNLSDYITDITTLGKYSYEIANKIQSAYFTALGRERYGLNRQRMSLQIYKDMYK